MIENYFDLVPVIKSENTWSLNEHNVVIINKKRTGIFGRIAIKIFGKSEDVEIELDFYGSLVWQKINGRKTICDIIDEVIRELGEERELAKKRAMVFFDMLRTNGLIGFE